MSLVSINVIDIAALIFPYRALEIPLLTDSWNKFETSIYFWISKIFTNHPFSHWAPVYWGSLICNHPFKTTAYQSEGFWWLPKLIWCVLLPLSLICNSACLVPVGSSMILSSLVQWLRNFSSRVNLIGILVTKHIIKLISTDKMSIKPALCAQSIQDMSYTSAVAALPILNTCIWSLMQD